VPRGSAVDTDFRWVGAIGTGGLFAFVMSALVHVGRLKATGFQRQIDLFWGYWDYVFIVLLSIPFGLIYGFSDPRLWREMLGAFFVILAAIGIAKYFVKRHLHGTSANSSSS
jgi:hypothetical protein